MKVAISITPTFAFKTKRLGQVFGSQLKAIPSAFQPHGFGLFIQGSGVVVFSGWKEDRYIAAPKAFLPNGLFAGGVAMQWFSTINHIVE